MGQSGSLMTFCIQTLKWMKLKSERGLSYIDPLTVDFFQNNGTSSIRVILLTNGQSYLKHWLTVKLCKPYILESLLIIKVLLQLELRPFFEKVFLGPLYPQKLVALVIFKWPGTSWQLWNSTKKGVPTQYYYRVPKECRVVHTIFS